MPALQLATDYRRIAQDYADAIRSGELPPGTQLPRQNEIAARYGVSRATVGRAFTLLDAHGMLASVPGKAIFVRDTSNAGSHTWFGLVDHRGEQLRHLYVIAYSDDVVKVGRSRVPESRIDRVSALPGRRAASLTRTWISPAHLEAEVNETRLIAFATARYERAYGIEYFAGADFETLASFASTLPMTARSSDVTAHLAATAA